MTPPPRSEPTGAASADRDAVAALLRRSRRPLLLIHRNPDGDCVGSATALAEALRALGNTPRIVSPDPLPDYLLAIPGARAITTELGADDQDMSVAIDVSDPALLAPLPATRADYFTERESLNIDHHVSNKRYARHNHVDPTAAAAAELIADLIAALGVPLTASMASDLLYGIVNDTYSFQNTNTTPRTLRLAADLVAAGADLNAITYNLLVARRPRAARLWSLVLPTLRFADGERVAFLAVSREALAESRAELSDTDGLVAFLRAIRGVDLAVLCKQVAPTAYRLSLRASTAVDATLVAGSFGGGGHQRAAGCDVEGDLDAVQAKVLAAYQAARGAATA